MTTNPHNLTDRELQVLQLIADGQNTKQQGGTIGRSPKTVEHHRTNLMRKLGCQDIPQLLSYALNHNLIKMKSSAPAVPSLPIMTTSDLAQALLRAASDAAAGKADVLQVNALCQSSDALIRLARLQMDAKASEKTLRWLADS